MGIWKEIHSEMGEQRFAAVQVARNHTFVFATPHLAAALNAADSMTARERVPAFVIAQGYSEPIYDCANPQPVVLRY